RWIRFFFQAEDGIRGRNVTGVQTCALPILGIVPLETAPELLQSISGLMPLSIVTQGLVHASLGGTLVTTASILLAILAWGVISVLATMFGSRTARRADRSERAVAKALPAAV